MVRWRAALLVAALVLAAGVSRAAASEPRTTEPDRSRELFDDRCASEIGVRQVTLFANGTVRVRDGLGQDPHMTLGEIGPDELAGYVRRLEAEDLSDVPDSHLDTAQGSWVEQCTLRLTLDGRPPRELRFARYDSLALPLSAVLRVVDEVAAKAIPSNELSPQYKARVGDVLRRADGVLFQVVGFTTDKQGVELQGVEQPLVLYLRPEDLKAQFVSVVSRRLDASGG